jgi:anaerobic magnesium-protoporphyrin IX monomethyl ester cyclase
VGHQIPVKSIASLQYQISSGGACGDAITTSGLPIRRVRPRKIHCILPSSPWLADSKTNIPLGVLYIAAVLRQDGHEVVVTSMLDKRYEGNIHLRPDVMDADIHMFGFCTPQFGEALELAAYIKDRNPEAILVAGGPHPSYEPREVLEAGRQDAYHFKGPLRARRDYRAADGRRLFDSVVIMEGEQAVRQLLTDLDANQLQPLYSGDKQDLPDLDVVPFPAWDLLPEDHICNDGTAVMKRAFVESPKWPGHYPVMSLIGTRGCPYKCTYCSTPWIGQKPRYRSPKNIIAEMRAAMDAGVYQFKFQDDTYTLHRTKLRELAEAIHAEFGPDSFACRVHTRVNTMDDHVAESLKLMNCKVVCFGIESGSQAVLDANQKGTKVAQNTSAVINAKAHGFDTVSFLVAGLAGETPETARETMAWIKSVRGSLDYCNLAVGIPYPGSRFWTHPTESGIEIVDFNYDNTWIVGFSARDEILVRPHGCTVEEMFQIKKEMFDFLVAEGYAKAEWDEDVRIQKQQDAAAKAGVLAASTLTYAGH